MISSAATRFTASITASPSSCVASARTGSELIRPSLILWLRSNLPFDRASHACNLLCRAASGIGNLHHCLEQLPARVGHRAGARSIETSAILQFQLGIEAEEIRRTHCVICACDLLALVP